MRRTASVVLVLAGGLGGCRAGSDVDADRPVYPAEVRQGRVLDVQVVRDETRITMTNTTARSIGPARLWLNGWYSLDIPGFGVGETLNLSLFDFKDRYAAAFRAGGFWATRKPERLVLAQIEPLEGEERELLGLVVVGRAEE